MEIDHNEIARLTEEYGGQWGINHTRRLLELISIIGAGLDYNHEALWIAAHLHDWGAYSPWAQKDIDHALRSRQVAEEYLSKKDCPPKLTELILECIELHHTAGDQRSLESLLLRDADILDFLGPVGVLRDVSKNTRDLRKAYQITKQRRENLPGLLCLEKAKELAEQRLAEMDHLLERFVADSFGFF
jgi:uncharacterized protein